MALLGWLILCLFTAALAVAGGLLVVGGQQAWNDELKMSFRSRPPRGPERELITLAVYGPLALVVIFIVLTIGRMMEMVVG